MPRRATSCGPWDTGCGRCCRKSRRELHLPKHRAADRAVGVGDRLAELEVVVALGVDQLDVLAGGFERCSELLRLAPEFRRLVRAIQQHDGGLDALELPLRR